MFETSVPQSTWNSRQGRIHAEQPREDGNIEERSTSRRPEEDLDQSVVQTFACNTRLLSIDENSFGSLPTIRLLRRPKDRLRTKVEVLTECSFSCNSVRNCVRRCSDDRHSLEGEGEGLRMFKCSSLITDHGGENKSMSRSRKSRRDVDICRAELSKRSVFKVMVIKVIWQSTEEGQFFASRIHFDGRTKATNSIHFEWETMNDENRRRSATVLWRFSRRISDRVMWIIQWNHRDSTVVHHRRSSKHLSRKFTSSQLTSTSWPHSERLFSGTEALNLSFNQTSAMFLLQTLRTPSSSLSSLFLFLDFVPREDDRMTWCHLLARHVTLIWERIEWTKERWNNRRGVEEKARPYERVVKS